MSETVVSITVENTVTIGIILLFWMIVLHFVRKAAKDGVNGQ